MKLLIPTILAAILFASPAARGEVSRVEISERKPFAGGYQFGRTGAYESISGRLYFDVDPNAKGNTRICDLRLAPKNSEGRVEFWADFFLLRPTVPEQGNDCLLYDVHNRGSKLA
jgi:hypothetical protein